MILKSFVFGGDCYDSSTDLLVASTLNSGVCRPLTESYYNEIKDTEPCFDNFVSVWYNEAYTSYCTDSTLYKNKKYSQQIYSFTRDYVCPTGKHIENGQCVCSAPSGFPIKTSVTVQSECTMSNPFFVAPNGNLAIVTGVTWSSCDNTCYATGQDCPRGQAVENGVCVRVEPPASACLDTYECNILTLGIDGYASCNLNCYCGGSQTSYFSSSVSCGAPLDDSGDFSGDNTPPAPDDSNNTSDSNTSGGTNDGTSDDGSSSGTNDSNGTVPADSNSTANNGNLDFLSSAMDGILNKYNIDYSQPCGSISPISFNFRGHTVTILSQHTIDMLPMSAIRAFIIFAFTLLGVLFAFRGGN